MKTTDNASCYPIIHWAGGKRQLLEEITKRLPERMGTYYEPFFGGGALYFDNQPKQAVINDLNSQLINVYEQIKFNSEAVSSLLKGYQNKYNKLISMNSKGSYYYEQRELYNKLVANKELSPTSAALFIFLNRTCFNGLYRVNSQNKFNVPFGKRKQLNIYDPDNFKAVSDCLRNATITNQDFEVACDMADKGDFVFFDSPYYGTFDTYQAGGFSEADHSRLAALYRRLSDKGVCCMLTNSNTDFIKALYLDYNIEVVNVKRSINSDSSNRTGQEIIITNYQRK